MNSRRLGRRLGPRQIARLNPPGDGRGKGVFLECNRKFVRTGRRGRSAGSRGGARS